MLYVRAGAPYTALMYGGGQESGLRAGTENMAGVAALGAVLEALDDGASFSSHAQLSAYRLRLAEALREALPGIEFNAPFAGSLPTTLNFSVPGFSSRELLDLFDAAGLRVSGGSACSSAMAAPSYVLEAMQLPQWRCAAAVRLSFGPMADAAFIDAACARIAHCGEALRASCLIPSAIPGDASDGIVQLSADGRCSWLVLDAHSRSCIVIDALAPLAARVADFIRCQDYQVRAIVDTGAHGQCGSGRDALLALLGGQAVPAPGGAALGWPGPGDLISIGRHMLARVAQQDGAHATATYLFGPGTKDGVLAPTDVAYAFTGPELAPGMAALVGPHTILCASSDTGSVPCTTLVADGMAQVASARRLDATQLESFLNTHPDAMLVDVREAFEHAAARSDSWHGRATHNAPLSRLADRLPAWLQGEPRPLIFFCRSGGRSARAAACLHRLGYQNAWHVAGALELDAASGSKLAVAA